MTLRYAALASGSKGNCHAFTDGERTLLIDAGISLKQILLRLESVGWDPGTVKAVAITHEHSDHVAALPVILRRTDWTILATLDAVAAMGLELPLHRWQRLEAGRPLDWSGWRLLPFAIPHDAADPVAYRVEARGFHAAVATDLGHPTALVADHLQDLDLLVLEANHDIQMLREGSYPAHLKARILSRIGHLSNPSCAELLEKVKTPRLKAVILAHLSEQNNLPELARFTAEEALRGWQGQLEVARQSEPMSLVTPA